MLGPFPWDSTLTGPGVAVAAPACSEEQEHYEGDCPRHHLREVPHRRTDDGVPRKKPPPPEERSFSVLFLSSLSRSPRRPRVYTGTLPRVAVVEFTTTQPRNHATTQPRNHATTQPTQPILEVHHKGPGALSAPRLSGILCSPDPLRSTPSREYPA